MVHQADRPWSGDRGRRGSRRAGEGGRELDRSSAHIPARPSAGLPGFRDGLPVSVAPAQASAQKGIAVPAVREPTSPRRQVNASDYGMPRAMPVDYAVNRGDQIEVVRALPSGSPSDKIEFVRTQPRSTAPALVASRFGQPERHHEHRTRSPQLERRRDRRRLCTSRSSSLGAERCLPLATWVARRPLKQPQKELRKARKRASRPAFVCPRPHSQRRALAASLSPFFNPTKRKEAMPHRTPKNGTFNAARAD